MVPAAQLVPRSPTHVGQKVIDPEESTRARNHFTHNRDLHVPANIFCIRIELRYGIVLLPRLLRSTVCTWQRLRPVASSERSLSRSG